MLKEQIAAAPEKAKEIIKEHSQQLPETIFANDYQVSMAEKKDIQKTLEDPNYEEKKNLLGALLRLAEEKGILNAIAMIREMDPSIEDAFHDLLVQYLQSEKGEKNV